MGVQIVRSLIAIGILAAATGEAMGQTITSRYTQLNFNYVYGAGGDSHVGGDNIEDSAILLSDSEETGYTGSTAGVLPGDPPSPYTAGVTGHVEQAYSIVGSVDLFRSISASGSTELTSSISGAGIASLSSTNNGNHVTFHFTIGHVVEYHLVGELDMTEPSFFSGVSLQVFDGFTWQWVFNSAFMPGFEGPFDVSGLLNPGQYRLMTTMGVGVFGSETQTGNFNYTLTVVRKGDMNCDGLVDGLDVQGFVLAALDPVAYDATYPDCNPINGDMNSDTFVTIDDIDAFVAAVLN